MQDIIKEYGPALITVIAIIALAGMVALMFAGKNGGIIGEKFTELINYFFTSASGKLSGIS